MNKISKKIVALATMAAFVLTLVPAAAFGAASATNSRIEVDGSQTVTDVAPGDVLTVDFVVNEDGDTSGVGSENDSLTNVKVWVTDKEGNFVDTAKVYTTQYLTPCANNSHVYKFGDKTGSGVVGVNNNTAFQVSFTSGGEYVIHAGVGDVEANGEFNADFINMTGVSVTVDEPDTTVEAIKVSGPVSTAPSAQDHEVTLNASNLMDDFDLVDYDGWNQNGTAKYTMTGQAFLDAAATDKAPEKKEVKIISGDPLNLQFANGASEITVYTDNMGEFDFTFTMNDKRNLPVYIEVDGVRYAVNIITTETTAYRMTVNEDGGYVLATTDSANWSDRTANFADAVQLTLTDVAGNVLTGEDVIANEYAHDLTNADKHEQNVSITEQPKKSTLKASDLQLVAAGDIYTLAYVNSDNDAVPNNDLYPGKYTVRIALNSTDYKEVTFYAAEFGAPEELELFAIAQDISTTGSTDQRVVTLDDQVTLGQKVVVSGKYVDENGLKITAKDVYYGVKGKAVIDEQTKTNYDNATAQLTFYTKQDIAANESLLGTLVTVEAYAKGSTARATAEYTVVDSYNDMSLEFDPVEGPTNEYNDVTVSVVKEDGKTAQVDGKIVRAFVDNQSNEDAIVTVKTLDSGKVEDGEGQISVYATEDTEADIVVVIQDASNNGIYSGTLQYTAGDGLTIAHHEVTMTIGSSQYVVDKQLFTMDAAPYVDSAWRTMIPIRALAEAFDAEVIWDQDEQTVTINYNEQTIVMTVGETTYTVNDEEMTMDTEPVNSGDRVYVPIRFVAEAMGFEVTPLYNANSSTASVVFQS